MYKWRVYSITGKGVSFEHLFIVRRNFGFLETACGKRAHEDKLESKEENPNLNFVRRCKRCERYEQTEQARKQQAQQTKGMLEQSLNGSTDVHFMTGKLSLTESQ